MTSKVTKSNIPNILEHLGFEPRDMGRYFIVRCPSCNRKESYLYKKSNTIVCNRKNKCGDIYNLWDYLKDVGYLLTTRRDTSLFDEEDVEEDEELKLPEGIRYFSNSKESIIGQKALNYLISRNIPEENINKLGYVYGSSMFSQTIFVPFYEERDLVYFICRDFSGSRFIEKEDGSKEPLRYLNPKGIDASQYVFNYDAIKEESDLFIFEGVFDALSLENQIGTASIKDILSRSQASKIWEKTPKRIILVTDNDRAGENSEKVNYNTLIKHKPPSVSCEMLTFKLPEDVNDFNDYAIKYNKNYIDIEECLPVRRKNIMSFFPKKSKAPL